MKGKTNNPNGRPKGSPNKTTKELRELITRFVTEKWELVNNDFENLKPKERIMFFEKLLQYVLPKFHSLPINDEVEQEDIKQKLPEWMKLPGQ